MNGRALRTPHWAEGDAARLAELHRREAAIALAELKAWLWEQASRRSLSIGKAAAYTLANWERLTRFVGELGAPHALRRGQVDRPWTTMLQRAIRGPVVGRKNHYGSKSRRGTEFAAMIYTVLETLKLHRKEPAAYRHADRGPRTADRVLLPWHFTSAA